MLFDVIFENEEITEEENKEIQKELMKEINKLGIKDIDDFEIGIEKKKCIIRVELFESDSNAHAVKFDKKKEKLRIFTCIWMK